MALQDSSLLGSDNAFSGRVRSAMLAACVAIANEGNTVANHVPRLQLVHSILSNPTNLTNYMQMFSFAVATDSTAVSQATVNNTVPLTANNAPTQGTLVTDAAVSNAVSAMFNSFCQGIPV